MKQKNLPDDIESKSLDELKEILNNLVEKIDGEETFLKKIRNFFDG